MAGLCQAQTPAARPILFVHGICDTAYSWVPLYSAVRASVTTDVQLGAQYAADSALQEVYYDGTTVRTWPEGNDLLAFGHLSMRFFAINLFDGHSFGSNFAFSPIETTQVASVSVLNKADEVAKVIQAITELTHVTDVIVIAHSMGGLDTRAYMEGLAVPLLANRCLDDGNGGNSTGSYTSCETAGQAYRNNDVAQLITLDTPHLGAALANLAAAWDFAIDACHSPDELDMRELLTGSYLVSALNDDIAGIPFPGPDIMAVRSWDLAVPVPNDGALTLSEQSINAVSSRYVDLPANFFQLNWVEGFCGSPVLHNLTCVGAQTQTATSVNSALSLTGHFNSITVNSSFNGITYVLSGPVSVYLGTTIPQTFANLPPGTYRVSSVTGGPSPNYIPTQVTIGPGNWSQTITISFGAPSPTVETLAATGVNAGNPVLQGTVNPNGVAASAWFRWGTDPTLTNAQTTQITPARSIAAGTAPVPVSFLLPDVEPDTTFYFQIVASDFGGSTKPGLIVPLATLAALPAPILETPANGGSGASTQPTFSWTSVPNSVRYRILIATTPNVLPTDPIQKTCTGPGCVWYDTPTNPNDVLPAGVLAPLTTYYWKVHAIGAAQFGTWSQPSSFTTGPSPSASDFSLQASPATSTASPSGTATYLVTTSTTSGPPESITLTVTNPPNGVTSAVFNPASVTSGSPSTLTVTLGSSVTTGSYTLTIIGVGGTVTHSIQVLLTVSAAASGPAVTLMPPSQIFPDQVVGTSGPAQTVAIRNSGGSPLIITALSLAAGSDYVYVTTQSFPMTVNPNIVFSFQVYFLPSTTGPRPGQIYVWDNAPGSPQVMSFTGNGLPAPPSIGTVQVNAMLNGSPLPSNFPFSYTLSGPSSYTGGSVYTFGVTPGTYTLLFSGCCSLTLSSITPSATQIVSAGSSVMYTMNFTAPNDFLGPEFLFPAGGTTTQIVPVGTSATFTVGVAALPGNLPGPVTLRATGIPSNATSSFDPQPVNLSNSILTVNTVSTTPLGTYTLALAGTNSAGLRHSGLNTAALIVTAPPSQPTQRVSVSHSGTQGNGQSWFTSRGGFSGDGRYVIFQSFANNLTSDVNNDGSIFIRDLQSGATSLVSLDGAGNPFLQAAEPLISADGRYVAFEGNGPLGAAVFVRDLQLGRTEREDVASDGALANGNFSAPLGISADGRFVLFSSYATNLVPGATTGVPQLYLRDRTAGTTVLVSVASDGTPANQSSTVAAMSADGRYIAFSSGATNLASLSLNGLAQTFLRDMQTGQTTVVSLANDDTLANQGVSITSPNPVAISADGRFIVFTSNSTNLTPEATDGSSYHLFLRDRQSQQTTLVDSDANGAIPGGPGSGISPSISSDGRFVAFIAFNEVLIRDMTSDQTLALSLAPDGTGGNGNSTSPAISPGGKVIAFGSASTNLVMGDTNGESDAFVVSNPFLGTSYVQSLTLSAPSVAGGSSISGAVVLSAPAPAGGASVTISVNNNAAQAPAVALVPAGATTGTFSIDTSLVSIETVLTVIVAYNGGSAVALLAVEPSPVISVNPPAWDFGSQNTGTTSSKTFMVQNVGTAPLEIGSINVAGGQVFHVSSNLCPTNLGVAGSCSVSVVFNPSQAGLAFSDALQISQGNPASVQLVALDGYAPAQTVGAASLSIDKNHSGTFTAGQRSAIYMLTVSNAGNAQPTSGMVTVAETTPSGLALVSMAGPGWNCPGTAPNNCTRSDVLPGGASYPAITVTVNVAANATSPQVNQASVSGGGSSSAATSDSTVISANQTALSLSPSTLKFGYSGQQITGTQTVALNFSPSAAISWTVSSNQSNITVSPTSGTGSAALQITATPGPSGMITVTAAAATNSPQQIQLMITSVTPTAPYGSFDTPAINTTGIAGAIPVTGWALDSIGVNNVGIWRDPVVGEATQSNGLVFIGNAIFVAGARPDVQATYPNAPFNYRAGWGYMLLTNFLPNASGSGPSGNGTYKLHAIITNATGQTLDLGAHAITVDNVHASKPFGTIDTPAQGGTVSGSAYVNFGWALTQNPYVIPIDGSTISVIVDGVAVGHPVYNNYRSDVANLFPGLANSNGAIGFFYIDATTLANGVHTMSWNVFDNAGRGDGIGSRYFTVQNTGTVAAPAVTDEPLAVPTNDSVTARIGFGQPDALPRASDGRYLVDLEELDRVEVRIGATEGHLLVAGERRSLPIGSTLRGGMFYWQAGPGFLGEYELVFQGPGGEAPVHVRVVIHPKSYSLLRPLR